MKLLFLLITLSSSVAVFAQDYFYLEDIKLRKKADFITHEPTVIKAVDYLLSTPVDEKNYDRKACTRFIIRFAQKTPHTTMVLESYLIKVYTGNETILTLYMGLWLKSYINNKSGTTADHEKYIFTEISRYAEKGNNIIPNDVINSLIKANHENTIEIWIKEMKSKKQIETN